MSDDKERNFDIAGVDLGGEIREDIIVSDQAKGDPIYSQIATDAIAYGKAHCIVPARHHVEFAAGAIYQDPIAWNRCIEAVITMISIRQDGAYGDSEYSELDRLKKDLEKLRR